MSTDSIQRKPATAPVPKPAAAPTSTQENAAFAARMKKTNAEQGKNVRSGRRDDERLNIGASCSGSDQVTMAQGLTVVTAAAQRQHDGQDRQTDSGWDAVGLSEGIDEFDADTLAGQLAPLSVNDGLFEVLLPNGKKLSVAMTTTANRLRILLTCEADDLSAQLKRRKKELEQGIARRTGKDVVLSVL
ncbi:hypothetical protein QN362_13655 [Actimicrobium sp. CCC2.4]|uniref:hypothetical protein n=1 Tax=Actimicrobium sp. CCC2.4 TaxID=3048606 RepID=UPI002AC9814C|nr:hypothetical protein [Actimicrobium sp. CCC2.4]MEB0136383.1 hypothetical protein [Actimicrobium sp. CCC2.4]WPX31202.1 hypothetical protein RHM62_13210 [Actimicrobium sp. CCC2.4]